MMSAEKWAYVFRKKPEECKKHDWDMEFPDPTSLGWIFKCSKCGKTRTDMPSVMEMI
jgi:hypothetical protein